MQFTFSALTLVIAASAVAMPAAQGDSEPLARRQSGSVGVGGICSTVNDCIGNLNCIQGGGRLICSRNFGLGQPCAQNAVSP